MDAKDEHGRTAFIVACFCGRTEIVKLLIHNSDDFNIDLNAKDNENKTGFQLVNENGKIIEKKMPIL